MSKSTEKRDNSRQNWKDHTAGKSRLEYGVMQHPDESKDDKSIYNFMIGEITKRKELHILPFKQYEKMGK